MYVHVPFCVSKCAYCGFYSLPGATGQVSAFLARLGSEVRQRLTPDLAARVGTVFIGGGNPTSLGPADFGTLLQTLTDVLGGSPIGEWTIETNPETWSRDLLPLVRGLPGLRLSLGLQRLRDEEIAWLGRAGTAAQGRQAVEAALEATPNVGIDLILGVPELPSPARDLGTFVAALPVRHVSAYFLSLEEDTPYAAWVEAGRRADPDAAGPEDLFEVAEALAAAGFEHYEISNFARPGSRCRHNLGYWHQQDYLGLGPAAVGTFEMVRRANPGSLAGWLAGEPPATEELTGATRQREFLMLRLRLLQEGLDLEEFTRRFGPPSPALTAALSREVAAGRLIRDGSRYRLSAAGLPLANQVIAGLF
ncbi:MAG: coproporphyrinogen III oxidase family protein [Candidatus Riflebacteria bacterium]|nr:coproporphyrinogen III oxidase family protein [Candidatus Riflebacteria bacterium]